MWRSADNSLTPDLNRVSKPLTIGHFLGTKDAEIQIHIHLGPPAAARSRAPAFQGTQMPGFRSASSETQRLPVLRATTSAILNTNGALFAVPDS